LRQSRFISLSVSVVHARAAGSLAGAHRDPFDRILIAQSRQEAATLISRDPIFRHFAVDVVWD
jgi:PIN domain nuclease of toxin-antitoxin system